MGTRKTLSKKLESLIADSVGLAPGGALLHRAPPGLAAFLLGMSLLAARCPAIEWLGYDFDCSEKDRLRPNATFSPAVSHWCYVLDYKL